MSEYILKSYNTYQGYSNVDNIPSAVGKAGYLRYDRDTGIKWRSNGTSWIRTDNSSLTQYNYSAIIYKSGSNYISDQPDGTNIVTNTDGSTVFNSTLTYVNGLTNGGVIQLADGLDITLPSVVSWKSKCKLRGHGKSTIIRKTVAGNAFDVKGTSGSHLSDFAFENIKFVSISVLNTQTRGCAIDLDYADSGDITGCEVSGFGGGSGGSDDAGIRPRRCNNLKIKNNDCHDNINGILTGTTNSPTGYETINSDISGNRCYSNFNDGIHSQFSQKLTINDNRCNLNLESGIDLLGSELCAVTGNTCNNNTHSGIEIGNTTASLNPDRYNSITGNTCSDNSLEGIQVLGKSEDNVISGNTCVRNTVDGIQVGSTTAASVSRNHIIGNKIHGNTRDGIRVVNQGADNNVVQANFVTNNSGRGIYVVNSGTSPTNNKILYNVVNGNTTAQVAEGGITGSTNTLTGNI